MLTTCTVPLGTLLANYAQQPGGYTDCYVCDVAYSIDPRDFVFAFYTTWLFKVERTILRLVLRRVSSDEQARAMADGSLEHFSAWRVEGRRENEILLCDFRGATRSWLMCSVSASKKPASTTLYFGSAIVPVTDQRSGRARLGWTFRLMLGFHKLYSRALLACARSRLNHLKLCETE